MLTPPMAQRIGNCPIEKLIRLLWFALFTLLLCPPEKALAQNPPAGAIGIGSTQVQGGVSGDHLTVGTNGKLSQATGPSDSPAGPSGCPQIQVSSSAFGCGYIAGGGTANAQTAALSPAITSLAAGLSVCWLPAAANTTSTPTLAVNGLAAIPLVKVGGAALAASDLTATAIACAIYDGTHFELQNPQTANGITPSSVVLAPVTIGTIAPAGTAGRYYPWFLDSPLTAYDDGTSWNYAMPGFGPVTRPIGQSNFTHVNFTNTTLTDANGGLYMTSSAQSGDQMRFAYLTSGYPATPYTKTICFIPNLMGANYFLFGLAVSDGTGFFTNAVGFDTGAAVAFHTDPQKWSSTSTVTGNGGGNILFMTAGAAGMVCLTINDDGTNLHYYASNNPFDLTRVIVYSGSRTANTGTPTRLGIFMDANNSTTTYGSSVLILHSTL